MGELTLEGLKDDLRNWESLGVLSHARTNNWCKYIDAAIREHDALRAEVERLRASQQWQPIETAPKDGTRIIVAFENGHVAEAKWSKHTKFWNVGDYDHLPWSERPFHWRPLPEPPTERGEG